MAWGKAGSTTLGSSSMTIDSGTITSSNFNQILNHTLATSNIENCIRFGNSSIDSGNNYAHRRANNGGSDSLVTSTNRIQTGKTDPVDQFDVVYAVNIGTKEKLVISRNCTRMTAGAGNSPERVETAGKWVNTSNQFDQVQTVEGGGVANFLSGSNISVLGSDAPTISKPTNVQNNSILIEKDTGKRYWLTGESAFTPEQLVNGSSEGIANGDSEGGINLNTGSALIGKTISQVSFHLKMTVNPVTENLVYCRLYRSGSFVHTFGTTDPDNITVGSYGWYSFGTGGDADAGNGSVTLQDGDHILLSWNRGGSYNDTAMYIELSSSSVYDGTLTNHIEHKADGSWEERTKDTMFKIVGTTPAIWTWDYSVSRGVFDTGSGTGLIMDYITIATPSNATSFGDLTVDRSWTAGVNSATRGIFGGGSGSSNVMDYITTATTGNATDFGNLTVGRNGLAGVESDVRGVFGGGDLTGGGSNSDTMDYITIATTGNATDFGNLASRRDVGGVSSDTRGIFGGGSGNSNVMDYITIATTGNSTDFGNLTVGRPRPTGVHSDVRGVFGGGGGTTNVIDYITMASTGNATDFGDLTYAGNDMGGVQSDVRGVFSGGSRQTVGNETIDYITIASTGNATDFGDLTEARNAHSGVEG